MKLFSIVSLTKKFAGVQRLLNKNEIADLDEHLSLITQEIHVDDSGVTFYINIWEIRKQAASLTV